MVRVMTCCMIRISSLLWFRTLGIPHLATMGSRNAVRLCGSEPVFSPFAPLSVGKTGRSRALVPSLPHLVVLYIIDGSCQQYLCSALES